MPGLPGKHYRMSLPSGLWPGAVPSPSLTLLPSGGIVPDGRDKVGGVALRVFCSPLANIGLFFSLFL